MTAPAAPRRRLTMAQAEERLAWLLVAPALLIIALVIVWPVTQALYLSFHEIDLKRPALGAPFVGLDNYVTALREPRFWNAMRVTSVFTGVSVALELVLGMIFALSMHAEFRGRGLVRAAVLVPWSLTTVVVARLWGLIYNSEYGILNSWLRNLSIIDTPRPWIADPGLALGAAIVADVWKATPFAALVLLAGLQLISNEQYEAARVDGASAWQQFWSITLPSLRPTILVVLLFRSIDAARVFDLLYVLTGGGPGDATESLNLLAYHVLFDSLDFGQGSAYAVLTFSYILIIAAIYIRVLGARREAR